MKSSFLKSRLLFILTAPVVASVVTFSAISVVGTGTALSVGAKRAASQLIEGKLESKLLPNPVEYNPNLSDGERTLACWFNTSAFAQPAALKFGTSGRGVLRGDGITNFDISALKNFVFAEKKQLQFRLEVFNALNHPDFGLPGHTFGAPGFGVVSSARSGRTVQVGLRLVF